MSRVPIRWRLTAAFALAMVLVLAAAAWFVYVRLEDDLTESVEGSLHARAAAVSASGDADAGVGEDTEESFAQVVSPASGRMLDSAGGPPQPALDRAALTRAGAGGDGARGPRGLRDRGHGSCARRAGATTRAARS